jgi:hypothetical protein
VSLAPTTQWQNSAARRIKIAIRIPICGLLSSAASMAQFARAMRNDEPTIPKPPKMVGSIAAKMTTGFDSQAMARADWVDCGYCALEAIEMRAFILAPIAALAWSPRLEIP